MGQSRILFLKGKNLLLDLLAILKPTCPTRIFDPGIPTIRI
jgi:hypothetical protein